jgi:hypothetical protein
MKRAVRNIIRLLAAGLIVFGGMEAGLEFMKDRLRQTEINNWHYIIGSLLVVCGMALFAISSGLAARVTGDYDDDDSSPPLSGP